MVPMTFIWWIYHFWARFWPYFNFVDFRAYFGPFSLVNRVQFSNADAGAWNSFLRLGIIFYGKLMHKDTKFCYSCFDISTFGFKAPPYCTSKLRRSVCIASVDLFLSPISKPFCGFWSNRTLPYFPLSVRPSSVTGVTSQLSSIIWWFVSWKPYIFWMHII